MAALGLALGLPFATFGGGGSRGGVLVQDAVGEWWTWPLATYENGRVVGGGISPDRGDGFADVVVWESSDLGVTQRYEIATALVDDHNCPAVLVTPGRRIVVAWNNHNTDHILHVKVSDTGGNASTLVAAADQTFDVGFDISYCQLHRITHLCTAADDVIWCFTRLFRGDGWSWEVIPLTVNQATGTVTRGTTLRFLNGTATHQLYAMVQDNYSTPQKLRVLAGYNPAATRHELYAFEIDVTSGAVTSLSDAALTANLTTPTNVPIVCPSAVPAVPDVAAGNSRRLFYPRPGPSGWAISYADWATATPDLASYSLSELNATGLRLSAGYVTTPASAAMNACVNGLEVKRVVKLDGAIPGDREVGRRFLSTGDRQWYVRITSASKLKVQINRIGNNALDYVSVASVPNILTGTVGVGFRWRYNGTNGVIDFIHSQDGGDTWAVLESQSTGAFASLENTTAPEIVGSTSAALQTGMTIYESSMSLWNGTTATPITGVDWTAQGAHATEATGVGGELWSFVDDAALTSGTSWSVTDLGIAGPRVGYTAAANYIGGIGFSAPCHEGDAVLVARKNASTGISTLEQWVGASGHIIAATSYYFSRPYQPINGGLASVHTEFTQYTDTFTEYEGNIRGVKL